MFGTVDAGNKLAVWDFLKLADREQMAVFLQVAQVQRSFPAAVVTWVK